MTQAGLLQQDAANRERALALESFIVEAPAGAGKTELLTQRYLKLLAVVNEPEEIVAITFTNKAAAEMRSRILDSLQRAAAGEIPDAAHKRITFDLAQRALSRSAECRWNLLEQPARLRINTIDSLCSSLARQLPVLSRFGGQPGVVDDAHLFYEEAAQRVLATLEDEAGEGVVTEALRYLDNDTLRLAGLLASMLAKRDQWLHHAGNVQREVAGALHGMVAQDIARAAAVLPPAVQAQLMPVARFVASILGCGHAVGLLLDWDTPIPPTPEALPLWRSVCEVLLTREGGFRKEKGLNKSCGFPADNKASAEYKQQFLDIVALLPDAAPLARIRRLPDPQSREEQRIVATLAQLLQYAAAHLLVVFQEAGEVDFIEVSARALQALADETGPTDLALKLDYRIQHLLVDEFQDTSPAQVQLLEKLTAGWSPGDGRTLFCVGDPMQSIYRFRKADVGLFLQVAAFGVGGLPLEKLHLTRNNRSCPAVVDWVNLAFEKVFPILDDEARGAICYRPFAATREDEGDAGVRVHPLVLPPEAPSDDLGTEEARYLARLLAEERERFPQASIAVLVRARSHLAALVAEIRSHHPDMRFQAVEIEALAGRQTVQDIHALTCALYHRADRVHWLAILRAPWCGLTLADMHALAADDHYANIWTLMQDEARVSRLSPDGQQRLRHVRDVLDEAFRHQGRQLPRRWVESVWLKLGGAQCLWDAGDVRDVEAFLSLLEGMQGFDASLLEQRLEKLYAAPDVQADGKLQFMTIHKSKGLEFDIVILPGLHRRPQGADTALLLWEEVALQDAAPQLVAAPYVPKHKRQDIPSAYDFLQDLEQEREANELARVLYVAATRARQRLHLVGALKANEKGETKPPENSMLGLLWASASGAFMNAEPLDLALPEGEGQRSTEFVPRLIRLPQPAIPALLQAELVPFSMPEMAEEGAAEDVGGMESDCGTLAHLYMEIFASDGVEKWSPERLQSLQPALVRWLQQQGHEEKESVVGAWRVLQALLTTLDSEAGQWVLKNHPEAASEYALVSNEGGQLRRHILDRTFVAEGARWIVDYKSARLRQASGEAVETYRPQLERYARLFSHEERPVRMAVFFLASGKLVEIGAR